jgi:hypothetical protein
MLRPKKRSRDFVIEPNYDDRILEVLMRECPSLRSFNTFIVPLMRVLPRELVEQAATEARRRKYKANKETGRYE